MTGGRADNGYQRSTGMLRAPIQLVLMNTGHVVPAGPVLPSLEALARFRVVHAVGRGVVLPLPGAEPGWGFSAVAEGEGGLLVHVHPPVESPPAAVIAVGGAADIRAWGLAMAELDAAGCLLDTPPQRLVGRWAAMGLLPAARAFRRCGVWIRTTAEVFAHAWHLPVGSKDDLLARDVDLLIDLDVVEPRRGWD